MTLNRIGSATSTSSLCYRAYSAWARAAGPFWQYVSALPFTVPIEGRPSSPRLSAGEQLADTNLFPFLDVLPLRTLVLIDLPLESGLSLVPALRTRGYLTVPQVFRWHGSRPLLPTAAAQSHLVWLAARLSTVDESAARGAAFILDAGRGGDGIPPDSTRLDNRYGYPSDVLPPAEALRDWATNSVALATNRSPQSADLDEYLARLGAEGFPISRIWMPARLAEGDEAR